MCILIVQAVASFVAGIFLGQTHVFFFSNVFCNILSLTLKFSKSIFSEPGTL